MKSNNVLESFFQGRVLYARIYGILNLRGLLIKPITNLEGLGAKQTDRKKPLKHETIV